jgi:hypothetical protein
MITEPESLVSGMDDQPPDYHESVFVNQVSKWVEELAHHNEHISLLTVSPTKLRLGKEGKPLFDLILRKISDIGVDDVDTHSETLPRKIILWEDLWHTKRSVVQHRLRALLGLSERIPARLTKVQRIDRPTTTAFLAENHLQDPVLSKLKYGLYLPQRYFRVINDQTLLPPEGTSELLVAVATFAHPRIFQKKNGPHRSYEFVRFANLAATTVVGGLDKLLKHFIRERQPDDIMTYADLEWSDGHSYLKLGFEKMGSTLPQEFWVGADTMQRFPAQRFPEGITEINAPENGFVKIKNAGSRKFVKTITP